LVEPCKRVQGVEAKKEGKIKTSGLIGPEVYIKGKD
jgi:hypothetical protein